MADGLLKRGFSVLTDPVAAYKGLSKRTIEDVLADHMKLLLLAGAAAGAWSLIYALLRAGYLDLVRSLAVDYWRLLNYSAGIAMGTFFFYLFAGTFLFFVLALLLRTFTPRPLTTVIGMASYALMPVFFFSWINTNIVYALLIWSVVLYVVGWKHAK